MNTHSTNIDTESSGWLNVEESHGLSDTVEGQNTCTVNQVHFTVEDWGPEI